jgi:hypothetical protein
MGLGKAQSLDSKILTPNGWVRMGDIQVGDEVFTPYGSISQITGCYPQGLKDLYQVEFHDHSVTECCIDHLWAVQTHHQRFQRADFRVRSLKEILNKPLRMSNTDYFRNYIPTIIPLDLTRSGAVSLDLHPYLLGALLGDGGFTADSQLSFTSEDRFIAERVGSLLPQGDQLKPRGEKLSSSGNHYEYCIVGEGSVRKILAMLDLRGHYSYEKFIPDEYLWTTYENRLHLLRGLMDTDGTLSLGRVSASPVFNTSSEELAGDVRYLVQSLGGTSTISYGTGRLAYNVSMRLPPDINPFSLPRKVELYNGKGHQLPLRGIKSVEHSGNKEAKCISIADPRGMYITDEFITTHNTVQCIEAWKRLGMLGPALLIARPNTQSVWLNHAPLCGIQVPHIVSGTPAQRKKEWAEVDQYSFMCCTLETLRNDLKSKIAPKKWGFVFVEEAHKIINRKIPSFKTVRDLRPQHIILITGSPMRRGFQDLFSLLYICNRQQFPSYWRFISTFGYTQKNEWGAFKLLGLKEDRALSRVIAPYYLRREKKDVAKELPPKTRILDIKLTPTKLQQKLYDDLRDEMIAELSHGQLIVTPTVLAKIVRLRQVLVTPKLLDGSFPEWGASLDYLGELLEDTDDHHFVVFTPFAHAIPIISLYLQEVKKFSGDQIFALHGGLRAEEVNERISSFRDTRGVMLCVISYAESFDLDSASWAYFNGFNWSVIENIQAEDRLHRLTTTRPVTLYYPSHKNCIDEDVLSTLNGNASEVLKVFKSAEVLRNLLKRHMEHS